MAETLPFAVERRSANRVKTPPCLWCGDDKNVVALIRRPQFIYFQCTNCGSVILKDRLVLPLPYGLLATFER
jgi:hypothetical protein